MLPKLKRYRSARAEEGFTLIELMIVVVIIGILAAVAIPIFSNQQKAALEASATSDLRSMHRSMEVYAAENKTLPSFGDNAAYVEIWKDAGVYDSLSASPDSSDFKRFTVCIPTELDHVYAIVATAPMLPDSKADSQGKTTVVVDQTGKVRHMVVDTKNMTVGVGGGLCSQALKEYFPEDQWISAYGKWTTNLL